MRLRLQAGSLVLSIKNAKASLSFLYFKFKLFMSFDSD